AHFGLDPHRLCDDVGRITASDDPGAKSPDKRKVAGASCPTCRLACYVLAHGSPTHHCELFMNSSRLISLSLLVLAACSSSPDSVDDSSSNATAGFQHPNRAADSMTLYEVQVRAANACLPGVGSAQQRADCDAKIAPQIHYRAEGKTCGIVGDLEKIKLGTL